MEKTYDPQSIEKHWYPHWEQHGYFAPTGSGQPYCIMIPPPNVTGSLHMGHGFQDSIMDALIRYQRMQGSKTLWQVGTDHAGIATQMVVERQLAQRQQSRHDLGREAFVEKIWQWKEQSGGHITQQLRRMGASVDWTRERFTLDTGLSKAVQKVFIDLYDEGLIYRGKRLVNWDPKLLTAISDLEVIATEEQTHLWHIRYPFTEGKGHITIATTRPETLLGDVAVAVNPDDERYQSLIGKTVQLPLCDRAIPIIADEYADPAFGSGCVKITPAHDFNDYEVGARHRLDMINILTPDAHINENAPKKYQGMERYEARKRIVEDLEQLELIEKIEAHTLSVPRGDRSSTVIEPYLTDQWFVNVEPLAKPAIDAVKSGKIRFIPENWQNTYFQWMENLQDWCISRQLWWGHRIPAWYDEQGNIYVGENEQHIREKYQLANNINLNQDQDVLDTWFSSALWPFSTLGWPEQTPDFKQFYPSSVLVTGFDIIFFWVARMIMFGLKFAGDVPFKDVYITGLIRDSYGQKMSKSKGNIIDPIDLIDGISLDELISKRTASLMQPQMKQKIENATRKEFPKGIAMHGTDALRFTYCALASTGRDIRFDIGRLEGYRNFCNKLWNASRYVLMNTEGHSLDGEYELSLADRWIMAQLQQCIEQAHTHFNEYRFDRLAHCLYDFIWGEYCDWYLELSKPILTDDNASDSLKRGTRRTLLIVLESLLRLLHPLMPFITEDIWHRTAPLIGIEGDSIMLQAYPQIENQFVDNDVLAETEWLKQIIVGIRTIRAEMNISPKKALPVYFHKAKQSDRQRLADNQQFLMSLAKLESISCLKDSENPPPSATALAGELEILIPLAGLIDVNAENSRLSKEIDKLTKDLASIKAKLDNPNFIDNAPDTIIVKQRERLAEIETALGQLKQQQTKIASL